MCACLWRRCIINETRKDRNQRQWEYKKSLHLTVQGSGTKFQSAKDVTLEKREQWRCSSFFSLWWGSFFCFYFRIYCMLFSDTGAETHTSRPFTSSRVQVKTQIWFIIYRFSSVTVYHWHTKQQNDRYAVQNVRNCQTELSSFYSSNFFTINKVKEAGLQILGQQLQTRLNLIRPIQLIVLMRHRYLFYLFSSWLIVFLGFCNKTVSK